MKKVSVIILAALFTCLQATASIAADLHIEWAFDTNRETLISGFNVMSEQLCVDLAGIDKRLTVIATAGPGDRSVDVYGTYATPGCTRFYVTALYSDGPKIISAPLLYRKYIPGAVTSVSEIGW
jgi:hypothetical protein